MGWHFHIMTRFFMMSRKKILRTMANKLLSYFKEIIIFQYQIDL